MKMKHTARIFSMLLAAGIFAPNLTAAESAMPAMHSHGAHMAMKKDERAALNLNANEAAMVRMEMRQMLDGVSKLIDAANRNDMKAAAAAAKPMGLAANREVMMSLAPKLPMEFRSLGSAMHQSFDQIAMDAEAMEDPRHTLNQLAEAMQRCVACHATFRIGTEPFPPLVTKR
jgi:hypothetical protein